MSSAEEARAYLLSEVAKTPYRPAGIVEYITRAADYFEVRSESGRMVLRCLAAAVAPGARRRLMDQCRRVLRRCERILPQRRGSVCFWLVPHTPKRTMPAAGAPVEPRHINGGYTYLSGAGAGADVVEIFILRREEFPKVMLHELLHHSRYNLPDDAWTPYLSRLRSAYKIGAETVLRPNEAVIETLANLHHCESLAREYGLDVGQLLEVEREHAAAKACRLRHHQATMAGGEWQEASNAWAYIVFRAVFLSDIPRFRKMIGAGTGTVEALTNWLVSAAGAAEDRRRRPVCSAVPRDGDLRMTVFGDL